MNKEWKVRLLIFIVTAIIFSGITVYAVSKLNASEIDYKDTTVEDALDKLYENMDKTSSTLLWTNSNPTAAFGSQTIDLNLSSYKYIGIVTLACNGNDLEIINPKALSIISVGYSSTLGDSASNDYRKVSTTANSITFQNAKYLNYDDNGCVIPYRIYGIKDININIY